MAWIALSSWSASACPVFSEAVVPIVPLGLLADAAVAGLDGFVVDEVAAAGGIAPDVLDVLVAAATSEPPAACSNAFRCVRN